VGFESTISAGERPQTYALDGATIGIGWREVFRSVKSLSHCVVRDFFDWSSGIGTFTVEWLCRQFMINVTTTSEKRSRDWTESINNEWRECGVK
jgi:hypothetical protein